jgi:hypothetical protein
MRTAYLVVLALALVACGGTDRDASPSADPSDGGGGGPTGEPVLVIADGEPTGTGLSVTDALGHRATDDLVTVSGALFANADGTVYLCSAIAESFPPQCGGDRILVDGLDLATVAGLQTEGDVSWAEGVTLFGSVE